jgi:hypothetical protein
VKTRSAKNKGRRLCADVRERLLSWAPDLKAGDIAVTPSGCTGEDLYLSPAAKSVYPLSIECKNQEALNIWASLKQAQSHVKAESGDVPVLVFTRNREGKNYIALDLEDFLKLVR